MQKAHVRDQLIRVGSDLIARRGFNSTGLNAVLNAAGVPRGSFYYYFASKEDFGLAVIDYLDAEHSARLERYLLATETPPLMRLQGYFDAGVADMRAYDYGRGCPIGNLSQELAGQNEAFRQRLDAVFSRWAERFVRCIDDARARGDLGQDRDVRRLAEFVLVGWEGATMRAKVTRSVTPMAAFAELLFERVLV